MVSLFCVDCAATDANNADNSKMRNPNLKAILFIVLPPLIELAVKPTERVRNRRYRARKQAAVLSVNRLLTRAVPSVPLFPRVPRSQNHLDNEPYLKTESNARDSFSTISSTWAELMLNGGASNT